MYTLMVHSSRFVRHPCAGHLYSAAVWISHVTVFGSISTHARRSRNSDLELVTIPFLLALAFRRFDADLLVVLLQRCKILARLRELTLLHALADVVMNERTLRVHQVELVVNARHHLRNRRAVRDHAHRTHDLGQITARDNRRRLVIDAALEAGRRPIDELD